MWLKVLIVSALVVVGVPVLSILVYGMAGGGQSLWVLLLLGLGAMVLVQRRQLGQWQQRMEAELAELRQHLLDERAARQEAMQALLHGSEPSAVAATEPLPVASAEAPSSPLPDALADEALAAAPTASVAIALVPGADAATATSAVPLPPTPALEVEERAPEVITSARASALAWFRGGNTIVRVAVLILFVGVAFLLRYAAEHDLLPLELRLAAVACGGVALLVMGWRLRVRRRGYALSLQGAGVGILYMTVYATMRLYGLLPPLPGLALMVMIAALAAVLALRQDALPLAVVGVVGGFAAPLLASTDAGGPVVLLAYCLVLNLGIAAISRVRAWRLLNLVGFACTSLVAAAWGAAAWQPALLPGTVPFLVAHWVLYLFVTVEYARRVQTLAVPADGSRAAWPYVDASLVFGVPLVVAGFQAVLVRHVPYALAASAAVMSAVYLLLGSWMWRRAGEQMRLLTESLLALGAVFLMLVAPLALDARWTAGAWAVQGAGMLWIALRQRRPWAGAFGLALQPLAALSFWGRPLAAETVVFVLNARYTGVLLLAASALACAWLLQRAQAGAAAPLSPRLQSALPALQAVALALGLAHLLVGTGHEFVSAPWAVPDAGQSLALWTAVLALASAALALRLTWSALAVAARLLLGLSALVISVLAAEAVFDGQGWAWWWPGGAIAVAAVLAVGVWLLRRLGGPAEEAPETGVQVAAGSLPAPPVAEAIALAWFAMAHGALAVALVAAHFIARHSSWTAGAVIVLPTLLAWGVLAGGQRQRWPFERQAGAWIKALALPWLTLLLLWSLWMNLDGDGAMPPLPYLPLLNPLDLAHGLMLLYALRLHRALTSQHPATSLSLTQALRQRQPLWMGALALVAFWWLTSLLVRTLHHYAHTPLWGAGALDSGLVQTGLSILWTVLALAAMLLAARRVAPAHARSVWLAGGALLAVVVVKLLLVDLSQTSALLRIVSFVGVGLLMLLVGYVAPLPPQRPPRVDAGAEGGHADD